MKSGHGGAVESPTAQGNHGIPPGVPGSRKSPERGFQTPTTDGNKGAVLGPKPGSRKAPLD